VSATTDRAAGAQGAGATVSGDVLLVDGLRVAYNGTPALEGVTLAVPHGAQVAVVGPNGAGKSTLFKTIVGLLRPQQGRVLIHGRAPGDQTDPVAYVPQREEVDWRFPVTVADVVMMGRYGRLGPLKRPKPADRQVVSRALEQLGIADLAGRPIGELSGGQQQRVFLARALAQEPHVLLLDEPFTGVDAGAKEAVLGLLEGLRATGITVLASTHDMATASERFELVVLLNRRLIAYGRPPEVFTADHLAAAFGGQALFLDGMVVVDQCLPGHVGDGVEHRHEHEHQTELWHQRDEGAGLWHERDETRERP
jgi:ABC-type Mn2+/Zn2+ transport system ATPase subunit